MDQNRALSEDLGLVWPDRLFRDWQFALALMVGCLLAFAAGVLAAAPDRNDLSLLAMFSLVVWYPVIEELGFRGAVQGFFQTTTFGNRIIAGLSVSNILTAFLFTGLHLVYRTDAMAWLVVVPGLVFGYFRDRHGSLVAPVILHSAYNASLIPGWYLLL